MKIKPHGPLSSIVNSNPKPRVPDKTNSVKCPVLSLNPDPVQNTKGLKNTIIRIESTNNTFSKRPQQNSTSSSIKRHTGKLNKRTITL